MFCGFIRVGFEFDVGRSSNLRLGWIPKGLLDLIWFLGDHSLMATCSMEMDQALDQGEHIERNRGRIIHSLFLLVII